ncbi:MAG: hypothetical protein V1859_11655 [archaeon]
MENINKKRIDELKKIIVTLEWDKKKNQLNYAKEAILKNYKEELEKISIVV